MQSKQKSSWIALVLSVLSMGFGYLYLGLTKRWMMAFGASVILQILVSQVISVSFSAMVVGLLVTAAIYIFVLIDSFQKAKTISVSQPPLAYQKKIILIPLFLVCVGFSQLIAKNKKFVAYDIPGGSMCPSALIGDKIMIEKTKTYSAGDIVVFNSPKDATLQFVKRVLAKSGDRVRIQDGDLFVNDKSIFISEAAVTKDLMQGCGTDYRVEDSKAKTAQIAGHQFTILMMGSSPIQNMPELTIPEKSFFVIGDNLYNSYDSRFLGVISDSELVGKALYVYFSIEKNQIKWNRSGQSLD